MNAAHLLHAWQKHLSELDDLTDECERAMKSVKKNIHFIHYMNSIESSNKDSQKPEVYYNYTRNLNCRLNELRHLHKDYAACFYGLTTTDGCAMFTTYQYFVKNAKQKISDLDKILMN